MFQSQVALYFIGIEGFELGDNPLIDGTNKHRLEDALGEVHDPLQGAFYHLFSVTFFNFSLSILIFNYQTCTLQISLSLFYFTFVSDAFTQMSNSGTLCGLLSLIVFSIAFFNFAGVSITKHMSATTRKVKIVNSTLWLKELMFHQ